MEQPEPTTQATDAEATAPPSPEVSASERQPETTPTAGGAPGMDAFIRGVAGPAPSTLKRADGDDDAADAEDTDGDPTPDGAAEPAGTPGGKVGRRRAPAEIARLSAEVERLSKALEATQPLPPPDPSDEARAARMAAEQRFRALVGLPDEDPLLAENDNYGWLQDEKRRRAVVPELAAHYETVLEADRAAVYAAGETERAAFWGDVRRQLTASASLPNTKLEDLAPNAPSPLRTWDQMAAYFHAAGATWKEAEYQGRIAQLERDLKAARLDGLGSARAPVGAGNSGGGKSVSIDNWIRGRL